METEESRPYLLLSADTCLLSPAWRRSRALNGKLTRAIVYYSRGTRVEGIFAHRSASVMDAFFPKTLEITESRFSQVAGPRGNCRIIGNNEHFLPGDNGTLATRLYSDAL